MIMGMGFIRAVGLCTFALSLSGCFHFDRGGVFLTGLPSSSTLPLTDEAGPSPGASATPVPFVVDGTALSFAPLAAPKSDFGQIPQSLSASFASFPVNSSIDVFGIKGIGSSLVVNTSYGLLVSNDRGVNWTVRNVRNGLSSDPVFDSIQIGNRLFVAQNEGLSVSRDGGVTFEAVPGLFAPGAAIAPRVARFAFQHQTLFAAYANGLLVSKDGGATFANLPIAQLPGLSGTIRLLVSANAGLVAVTTGGPATAGVFVSKDDGRTWTRASIPASLSAPLTSIIPAGIATLGDRIVVSTGDALYVWSDGGRNFVGVRTAAALGVGRIPSVAAANGKIYVAGAAHGVHSTADGVNYAPITFPMPDAVASESFALIGSSTASGELYAIGRASGGFYASANGFGSVTRRAASNYAATMTNNYSLQNLYANDATILVAGNIDAIYYSGDGGRTFAASAIRIQENGFSSSAYVRTVALSGTQLVAATSLGLYTTNAFNPADANANRVWTKRSTENGLPSDDVTCGNASGAVVVACTSAGFAFSSNGGASFGPRTTANGLGANSVRRFVIGGFDWFLATTAGIARSTNGGSSFTNVSLAGQLGGAADVNYVQKLSNAQLYAVGSGGFARSLDNGATWQVPTLKLGGVVVPMSVAGGTGIGANLLGGAALRNGKIYVGTSRGLAVSADNGATFTILSMGGATGSTNVNPYTGVTDVAVTPGNELYFTTQRGIYKLLREPVL